MAYTLQHQPYGPLQYQRLLLVASPSPPAFIISPSLWRFSYTPTFIWSFNQLSISLAIQDPHPGESNHQRHAKFLTLDFFRDFSSLVLISSVFNHLSCLPSLSLSAVAQTLTMTKIKMILGLHHRFHVAFFTISPRSDVESHLLPK